MNIKTTRDIKTLLIRMLTDPKQNNIVNINKNQKYINNVSVNAEMTAETKIEADIGVDKLLDYKIKMNNQLVTKYSIPNDAINKKLIFCYDPSQKNQGNEKYDASRLYLSFENINKENINRLVLLDCVESNDIDYKFCMHYQLCKQLNRSPKIYSFLYWRSLESCSNDTIQNNKLPVVFANTNINNKKVIFRSINDMDYVKAYKSSMVPFNSNKFKSICFNTIDAYPDGYDNKSISNYTTVIDPLIEYITEHRCQKYQSYLSNDEQDNITKFEVSSLEHSFEATPTIRITSQYHDMNKICQQSGLVNGYRLHSMTNNDIVKIINIHDRPIFFLIADCPVSYNGDKFSFSAEHMFKKYICNNNPQEL